MISVRNLDIVRQRDPKLYETLTDIISQTVDVNVSSPPPVTAISVTSVPQGVAVQLTDSGNPAIAVNYFTEYSSDPNFINPPATVYPMGPSRNAIIPVGSVAFYYRAYSQYVPPYVNQPNAPIVFGSPTLVTGGSANALPPSTGSGTAPTTGQQPGSGFGKVPMRLPTVL